MTEPYANAPLVMVAMEVRFPLLPSQALRAADRDLRSAVKPWLPLADSVTHTNFELGAGLSPPTVDRRRFPRFKSRDSTMALVVKDSALVIETTKYHGYSDFRETVERLIEVVSTELAPDGVTRVGLRFIDEIRIPAVVSLPGDWRGYIAPALLAAVDDEFLPEGVTAQAWQGVVSYGTGTDQTLILRYGPGDGYATDPDSDGARRQVRNPPGPYFLLDSDSSWTANNLVPEFETSMMIDVMDRLHGPVSSIFKAACTDTLRNIFDHEQGLA